MTTQIIMRPRQEDVLFDSGATPVVHEHLVSCLVENHVGVLARITGMFTARGFNIESVASGTTQDPTVSRITIACPGDDRILSQILKHLHKIIEVISVCDISEKEHVERELMLIKVACTSQTRSEIMQVCDIFRARIVDVDHQCLIIEVSGTLNKNEAILEMFAPFGILEMTRTGRIALQRGAEVMEIPK